MRDVLAYALATALLVHLAAHVALAVRLGRAGPAWRGLVVFVVPPLACWWGFEAGHKRLAQAWLASVALYAALVAAA